MKTMIGMVGLGRMGGNLSLQAMEKGIGVAGYDKGPVKKELREKGLVTVSSFEELVHTLAAPRMIFLYIPAGPDVDEAMDVLSPLLSPGDIIVDGGNSYWGDSVRRAGRLEEKGLYLVDLGTSGGVEGARTGACFMAGGREQALERVEPVVEKLAVPGGYVRCGGPGSGHFVKLVHNGIEFGMLQAIGEGIDLLEHFPQELDIGDILRCWRNGSVIRGWLIELMEKQLREHRGLDAVPGYVEDTGEVNWLVTDAMDMEVPVPVITLSVVELLASRDRDKNWAKAVALMRRGFGGHPLGASRAIAAERRTGKINGCTPAGTTPMQKETAKAPGR